MGREFTRNWNALRKKSFHAWRESRSSRAAKSVKTIKDQTKRPRRRTRRSRLRKWAKRALAQRFVSVGYGDAHTKSQSAGLSATVAVTPPPVKERKLSRLSRLVGDAKRSKLFIRALRRVLADSGCALVGPLPFKILERLWLLFGERLVAPHGVACWCTLCRSSIGAHMSTRVAIQDVLVSYLRQMPVRALFGMIAPAPLKTAKFVANKLWQWLKVLLPGYMARLRHRARVAVDRLLKWWMDWVMAGG